MGGIGHFTICFQLISSRLHLESDLPMTGMIAKGYRCTIICPNSPVRIQNQIRITPQCQWVPTHTGTLCKAKEIAAG